LFLQTKQFISTSLRTQIKEDALKEKNVIAYCITRNNYFLTGLKPKKNFNANIK
jgi:hypothetical protein